jgi:uncharacterized protein YjbI with pentapeptide repeats
VKTIKPMKVGVLVRPFSHRNRNVLSVALFLYVPFPPARGVLTEPSMWKAVSKDVLDSVLDVGMPKPRGEWLVDGSAYASDGVAQPAVRVRAKVGEREKTLLVSGDRYWEPVSGAASPAQPFTEMPLSWARTWGGPEVANNPLGRGQKPVEGPSGPVHWLPNVEHADRRVRRREDVGTPVSFGATDVAWPQRMGKAGTYDQTWLERDFPGFAADIDWTMWNSAQPDQWIDGFFRGDETFEFEGMHPTKPVVSGALPPFRGRSFVTRKTGDGEVFTEVPLQLETLRFFPHRERVVMLFRGVTEVSEDDASDVSVFLAACEQVGAPKPVEHYRDAQARRLDKERGGIASLRDSDLMPEGSRVEPASVALEDRSDMEDISRTAGLLQQNLRRRKQREVESLRRKLAEANFDPDTAIDLSWFSLDEDPNVSVDLENLPEEIERVEREGRAKEAEARQRIAAAEADGRKLCEELGLSWDEFRAQGKVAASGPPKSHVREELASLRAASIEANGGEPVPEIEAMFEDQGFTRGLETLEKKGLEAYRGGAHHQDPAPRLDAVASAPIRARVAAAHAAGASMRGWDLTGADLSAMDLTGADLTEALCESCSFAGSVLDDAKLDGAVLAHGDLGGARLHRATMVFTNLGKARLCAADLTGANLTDAIAVGTDFASATLDQCSLERIDLHEAQLRGGRFRGAVGHKLVVMGADLRGADFTDADLSESLFHKAQAEGVVFERAKLVKVALIECDFTRAKLRGAMAENLRCALGTTLAGADLVDATIDLSSMRALDLTGADLSRASMNGADLTEAKLTGARLWRVKAHGTRFLRADLTDAFLQGGDFMDALFTYANVTRADFTGANLFAVDFARIQGSVRSLTAALTTRARVMPRRAP